MDARSAAVRLGMRLFDDTVWKTARLANIDLEYRIVAPQVNQDLVRGGTRVSDVVLVTRVERALGYAIARADHRPDFEDERRYARILHETVPEAVDYATPGGLLASCRHAPLTGAVLLNHVLMADDIGLFAVPKNRTGRYLHLLSTAPADVIGDFVDDEAVERLPGGLTGKDMRDL